MRIPIFQIDAFTSRVFSGNPAAVCPLEQWLDDAILQAIAAENNLAETAFFVKQGDHYDLRWFTPAIEIDLCGHATLASALVIFERLEPNRQSVSFQTRSGRLEVRREQTCLVLDFPARPPEPCNAPDELIKGLGRPPREVLASRDYMAVYDTEEEVRSLQPDIGQLAHLDRLGVIVTAPGKGSDFVSRFFAPKAGVPEDPATGSAHCTLIPYWSQRLGKQHLHAFQISLRGAEFFCTALGDRVLIGGHAVNYLEGTITI